jgi:hypothetical protein
MNYKFTLALFLYFVIKVQGKCVSIWQVDGGRYACNDVEQGMQCQYAQDQIDAFANRIDFYFLLKSDSINNSVIWQAKPFLGCGTDVAVYCNSVICKNNIEAQKCLSASALVVSYIFDVETSGLNLPPWLKNSIPIIKCKTMPIPQTSSAPRTWSFMI